MTAKKTDPQALIEAYFIGSITDDELRELESLMENDKSLRDDFRQAAQMDAALRTESLRYAQVKETASNTRKKQFSRQILIVLTVTCLITLGLIYVIPILFGSMKSLDHKKELVEHKTDNSDDKPEFKVDTSEIASVIDVKGTVQRHDSTDIIELKSGDLIKNNDIIICPKGDNQITIKTYDGSRFIIGTDSRFKFFKKEDQYKHFLENGNVIATIQKQKEGKPLTISTKDTTTTVLGTRFTLNVSETGSQVSVEEGKVSFFNKITQKELILTDNQKAVYKIDKKELRKTDKYSVDSLKIIKAEYGSDAIWRDVTAPLKMHMKENNRRIITGEFVDLAGDPLYQVKKTIKIDYEINGKQGQYEVSEYIKFPKRRLEIILPIPQ